MSNEPDHYKTLQAAEYTLERLQSDRRELMRREEGVSTVKVFERLEALVSRAKEEYTGECVSPEHISKLYEKGMCDRAQGLARYKRHRQRILEELGGTY